MTVFSYGLSDTQDGLRCLRNGYIFVLPAKHGPHMGIVTPSSVSALSGRNTFDFWSKTFEGVHKFHSKFTK